MLKTGSRFAPNLRVIVVEQRSKGLNRPTTTIGDGNVCGRNLSDSETLVGLASQRLVHQVASILAHEVRKTCQPRADLAHLGLGRPQHALDNGPKVREAVTEPVMDEATNVPGSKQTDIGNVEVQEEPYSERRIMETDHSKRLGDPGKDTRTPVPDHLLKSRSEIDRCSRRRGE